MTDRMMVTAGAMWPGLECHTAGTSIYFAVRDCEKIAHSSRLRSGNRKLCYASERDGYTLRFGK
jgi:hypothetical protein